MKLTTNFLRSALALVISLCTLSSTAQDRDHVIHPTVIQMEFLGETVALRDFVADPNFPNEVTKVRRDGYHPKSRWILNENINPNAEPKTIDPAYQTDYPAPNPFKSLGLNFNGIGNTNVDPADPSVDVGPNHVIQMINGSSGSYFKIWNKTGGQVMAQTYFDTFFNQPGGAGDPIVLYDAPADRWLMSEFTATGNRLSVAVSSTADPMGTWYKYTFTAPNFPDYPKYSIWNNAYIVTTNENSSTVYALDRTNMLAGTAATSQRFTMTNFGTIAFQAATPVNLDGTTLPPAGTPAMVMRMRDDAWSGAASDALEIWSINLNWNTPANSTLTQTTTLPVTAFSTELCGYTSFACVPQQGSGVTLDPLREVLMNRIHYRNFGTHESIVCCHAVDVDNTDHAAVRWYELRRTGGTSGTWSIYQQGTYSPDASHRWMASIGISASGNIGLAYNVSANNLYPSLRYTGRKSCDPLGTMTEPETVIIAGTAANASNRYGDYNALGIDPADGETFWFTGMYNASGGWNTRIASFDIAQCSASVQFTQNTYNTTEGTTTIENGCLDYTTLSIPITIGQAPSANTVVTVNVTGGTATQGIDYMISNTQFTFASGTLSGTVTINVYDDAVVEGNETITLAYTMNTNGGNAISGTINQTVTVTINDDDVVPSSATSAQTIFTQNFESGLGTTTTVNASGATPWAVGTATAASSNAFTVVGTNTTQMAWINDDACDCNQNNVDLIFPSINLTGYTTATLTFDSYYEGNTYQGITESAKVFVSVNNGTYVQIGVLTANATAWAPQSFNLTPYVGNTNVKFKINYSDGGGWLYGCAVDNISVTGTTTISIQTAVNTGTTESLNLGPNQTIYAFNTTPTRIMLSLNNQTGADYGCITAAVDRSGDNPSAVAFASNTNAEFVASKTFAVSSANAVTGNYTVSLYYKEAEIAAWESATGNSRTQLEVIKVTGLAASAITPTNYSNYQIDHVPATLSTFNGDVIVSATFNNGIGNYAIGIFSAEPTAPTAQFSPSTLEACVGDVIQFTNQSFGNATSYSWNMGDGSPVLLDANVSYAYTAVGTYTVTLQATNDLGSDTQQIDVVIHGPSAGAQTIEICQGESITVGNNIYSAAGIYEDLLINAFGCDSVLTTTLVVHDLPAVSIAPLAQTTFCTTDPSVTLNGLPAGGTFSGTGMTASSFNPNQSGVGNFTITYNYTDDFGCTNSATEQLTVQICQSVDGLNASQLNVSPNPSTGKVILSGAKPGSTIRIYSESGQLVHQSKANQQRLELDLIHLAAGKYNIVDSEGRQTSLVIVQH